VVFVKGIEEENISQIKEGSLQNHPFLDLLDLDKIPQKKGEARLLTRVLDYSLLFDNSKQPFKIERSNRKSKNSKKDSIQFIEMNSENTSNRIANALSDLTYDKNHPLEDFYLYNGSFSKPPCDENATYVIKPIPILAPLEQIIVK
jgi:carbonic anhydrase